MAGEQQVRPSRDGDQFHYFWAARRCLGLLPPGANLVAVSIEGPAVADGQRTADGVNSIDVAEYCGSTDPRLATRVRYLQLKHSTWRKDREWVASELADTLRDFARRYLSLVEAYGREDVAARFSFEFVTNRPIAPSLEAGLAQLRSRDAGAKGRAAAKAMGLTGDNAFRFADILVLSGGVEWFLTQRSLLQDDVSGYLPEADRDAPLQMKDLVERRATTEFQDRPEINRFDVLKALGVDIRDLYPSPSLIELPSAIVPREQLAELAATIVTGPPLSVISADAGVGKSVISTQLGKHLPPGSETFVYDCFGNGAYRSASGYRHRCRDGLVQLANEFAGRLLSEPLLPTSKADTSAYVRAFLARAGRACDALRARSPEALLCVVIDAADNAQVAADELHEGPSFPRLLLREAWPANMRVVLTARPHRVDMLDPPAMVQRLELDVFNERESASHLRKAFPDASPEEALEFHRQTSMNPRVQATALAQGQDLPKMLRRLAGTPRTVETLIGDLLEAAVAKVLAEAPQVERVQINRVCAALATLRPFVPLDIVALVADVPTALVRSLSLDLQRPLIVREDAIQFRDEPTETWFRQRFRPTGDQLNAFIERLLPTAAKSAYVAAGLPQLLLEAGRFDELVSLALSDRALPAEPAMARRDVALQRLQFALKAAIRDGRHVDAAKLALKAGGETAADARQQKLISANTDLAAHFLEPDQMLEQVMRRLIAGGGWTGSEHAYEAAFLSGPAGLVGDALSRLRMANDWLRHWATRPPGGGKREGVSDRDIAEMALAELNLQGAASCAKSLRRWRARERSYGAGRILVSRLVDAGRFGDVDALAIAAGNDIGLLFAVTSELACVGRLPCRAAVERTTRLITSRRIEIRQPSDFNGDLQRAGAVTDVVVAARRLGVGSRQALLRTMTRYMPAIPGSLEGHSANYKDSRRLFMRAYCVRAAMRNETVTLDKLRPHRLRPPRKRGSKGTRATARGSSHHVDSGEAVRFAEEVGALLPWHVLAADVGLGRVARHELPKRIEEASATSRTARQRTYDDGNSSVPDEMARLWALIALDASRPKPLMRKFEEWRRGLRRQLYIPTLLAIARHAGRTKSAEETCLTLARAAFDIMSAEREDAQGIADTFVDIARAVLTVDAGEAREFFEQAIQVSGKIGEENVSRWQALSDLAGSAGRDGTDRPELAYRYSRVAELVLAYTENFDWERSIGALVACSSPSGPTILSRWIDRRFARQSDTLPDLVGALRARDAIDPRDAICLLPFAGTWPRVEMLRQALHAATGIAERENVATHFVHYARRAHLGEGQWREAAALLKGHGLDDAEATALAKREEKAAEARAEARGARPSRRPRASAAPTRVFRGLSLTSASDLEEAHRRFRSGSPPYYMEVFFRGAITRLRPGQEAPFLAALASAGFTSLHGVRQLLEVVPDAWSTGLATRRELAELIKCVARRESSSITTSTSYPPLSWERIEAFGVRRVDVFREAVSAYGETSLPSGHDELFALAGLLSTMVTPDEAAEALDFGLALMEPLLLDGDDGPWRPEIAPPPTMPEALAGYVWAALASPWAERRWEGAHTVRALCLVGRDEVLRHLAAMAEAGSGGPFAAPDLTFYALHAKLWLVIGLARAAAHDPERLAPFLPLLRRCATRSDPHVLIRDFAAMALLAIPGGDAPGHPSASELRQINVSHLQRGSRRPRRNRLGGTEKTDDSYTFGYDFRESWISPFHGQFEIDADDLDREIIAAIRGKWGADQDGHYKQDARSMRRQFADDGGYRSRGNWPRTDDLSFYQSVHGMLITAGILLDRAPLAGYPDETDPFDSWLRRFRLSLGGGQWLADRRDDKPAGLWLKGSVDGTQDRLGDDEVIGLLGADGLLVASADWECFDGDIRQRVDVDSVLVSADRSDDLARSLQSARDHQDYRLPTTEGDEDETDEDRWRIRGWLRPGDPERGIDRHDPWAAGLSPRIPAPGEQARSLLGVEPDAQERAWCDANGTLQLRANVWSDGEENDRDLLHDRGRRLLARRSALDGLMRRTGLHLLLEVQLQIDRVETRYNRYRDSEKFDAVNVTRYVVLRPGHEPEAAPRRPGARRGARRRTRPGAVE